MNLFAFLRYYLLPSFIFLSLLANCSAEELLTPVPDKPEAPDFMLHDINENIKELDDYKGKPIIINFWASWCPPCRAELPSMNKAWKKLKDEGIEMIGINIAEEAETVSDFIKQYPINFPVLLDESGEELENWSIRGLPTTFILDSQGRIVYRAVGGRQWDNKKILDKIRALIPHNPKNVKKGVDGL